MTKRKETVQRPHVSAEKERAYVATLTEMLRCRTVYKKNGENAGEYRRFYAVLKAAFPRLHARAERLTFGSGCFVYCIKGENATKNIMLMSHHDVVDGGEGWSTNPFEPVEKDGFVYARGAIDTKTPLFAELQACEELLEDGFSFEGFNLYIGSSNNEEVSGDGMVLAVSHFKERGIFFDLVLDEGGAITEGMIPGVSSKSALVAVHEKSRHLYRCTASISSRGHGGFGGAGDSALSRLCAFITEAEKKQKRIYRPHFAPEVRETFAAHAPYMRFPLGLLFGHMTLFSPLIKGIMSGIPAASAMLSTGMSFTVLHAGDAEEPQLRAKEAEAYMLLRCIREEDLYRGLEKLRAIGKKHGVELSEVERDYCRPTDFKGEGFALVRETLAEVFLDVLTAPFLLTAGTDARRFTDIAAEILRFAPIELSRAQFASVHGANENIGVKSVCECVIFYRELIKKLKNAKENCHEQDKK